MKNNIERGLVEVESRYILHEFTSEQVYKSLKKNLTKKYQKVKSEIDDLKNKLKQIGNKKKWFDWVDDFSDHIKNHNDITEKMKKELLKVIIDTIIVNYDKTNKLHLLNINFKIPVVLGNEKGSALGTQISINPTRRGRKKLGQLTPVRNYSTVTDFAKFLG